MTDTVKLDEQIRKAKHAESLLRDEMLNGAFFSLENDFIAAWRATGIEDSGSRERLWQALQLVGKVRNALISAVNDGKVAQHEIDAIADRQNRKLKVA